MARIPDDELERLKREVSIADLLRARGVELKRVGKDLRCRCPLHGPDDNPSFSVDPERGVFHCFGCGAKGSVIDLVMLLEGVSFRHALEILLADHPSVCSRPADRPPPKRSSVQKLPSLVAEEAGDSELRTRVALYYHETLKKQPEPVEYLRKRGLDPERVVDRFKLGYSNRTLGYHIPHSQRKNGKAIRTRLQELGIIKDSGHELMRGSLTIPVLDEQGQVVQIYGRKIGHGLRKGVPRHLYLPGRLRGIWNRAALAESREIVLCEALIDALTFCSAGYTHVTATWGKNGFTEELLQAFKAYATERVLIAFDRDDESEPAAEALAHRLGAEGISCFRVRFPRGMDANDYALKVTPPDQSLGLVLRSAEHISGPLRTFVAAPAPETAQETTSGTTPETDPETTSGTTPEITPEPTPAPAQQDTQAHPAPAGQPPTAAEPALHAVPSSEDNRTSEPPQAPEPAPPLAARGQAQASAPPCGDEPRAPSRPPPSPPEPPEPPAVSPTPPASPPPPPTTDIRRPLGERPVNQQPTTAAAPPSASPIPPPPRPDIPAEVSEHQVVLRLGDRYWRVRGLAKNLSFEQMRVNLFVGLQGAGDRFHQDTFDLYSAKQRHGFIRHAAVELGATETLVKKDLGQVLLKLEQLQEQAIREALEARDETPTMSTSERAAALRLLEQPELLDRIAGDLERCGVVGERTNKLVAYLAAVSRKLAKPLAVMVQSSSAAGKSALMNAVLGFLPEEELVAYSAMTGQSLFYMGEADLKHKVLAIAEEEGAEKASYALKLLQSEGELTIASTGKDPATGRLVTHEYRVEGPTAILTTTTAVDLDEELLNRCIVLTVDESREQTQAIHRWQREEETLEGYLGQLERQETVRLHQNAQRLLRPLPVVNPYARQLTFLDAKTRTRRDHLKYLALIRAIALLHQHQRPLRTREHRGKPRPYIEVAISDISAANQLAAEVLGRCLDELPPQTRRFLLDLDAMVAEACQARGVDRQDHRFTARQVRESTGWGATQVKVHLRRLVDMEYLLAHRASRGQGLVYELLYDGEGQQGEPFLIGLIDVERLDKQRYDEKRSVIAAKRSASEAKRSAPEPERSAPEPERSASEAKRSGSGRPLVGPWSGGGRTPENGRKANEEGHSDGAEGETTENAPLGDEKASAASYLARRHGHRRGRGPQADPGEGQEGEKEPTREEKEPTEDQGQAAVDHRQGQTTEGQGQPKTAKDHPTEEDLDEEQVPEAAAADRGRRS